MRAAPLARLKPPFIMSYFIREDGGHKYSAADYLPADVVGRDLRVGSRARIYVGNFLSS